MSTTVIKVDRSNRLFYGTMWHDSGKKFLFFVWRGFIFSLLSKLSPTWVVKHDVRLRHLGNEASRVVGILILITAIREFVLVKDASFAKVSLVGRSLNHRPSEMIENWTFQAFLGDEIMKFQPEALHYGGESFLCVCAHDVALVHTIIHAIFLHALVFLFQSRRGHFCVSLPLFLSSWSWERPF